MPDTIADLTRADLRGQWLAPRVSALWVVFAWAFLSKCPRVALSVIARSNYDAVQKKVDHEYRL